MTDILFTDPASNQFKNLEKEYLVYCHADGPSISAANKLVNAGFTMVYRLEGNYQTWVDAGYPIET